MAASFPNTTIKREENAPSSLYSKHRQKKLSDSALKRMKGLQKKVYKLNAHESIYDYSPLLK